MTQQLAKFEKMSNGTTNLQRSCIEAQLKKLHNFNPDERVAKFPKKNSYGTTISKKVVRNANLQIARQLTKEICKSCKENIELLKSCPERQLAKTFLEHQFAEMFHN